MTFGERLRLARQLAKLSQKAMAVELGVSQGYLNDVERGRRNPTPKIADAMADWERARQWPDDRPVWHVSGARECGWRI